MKIDSSLKKTGSLGVESTQTRAGKGADKAGSTSSAPVESDSVHLSSQAQSLTQMAGSGGVFDTNKVEEIKAAIAEGRFQVDPEKVANGLLDSVSDLIRTRKG